jgi:NitT/TauT family transport system permease protein
MIKFLKGNGESDEARVWFNGRTLIPLVTLGIVLALHLLIPAHPEYRPKALPWFSRFLIVFIAVFADLSMISVFSVSLRKRLAFKSPFLGVGFLLLGLYNLITIKWNLIPSLYFPAPERIIGVFFNFWLFLLPCLAYSLRLLLGRFYPWGPCWDIHRNPHRLEPAL